VFLIGLFLILALQSLKTGREATPDFDGTINHYELTIAGQSSKAIENDLYSINLKVTNEDDILGRMLVQCSIFDRDWAGSEWNWLRTLDRQAQPDVVDNCKTGEKYTQTAAVELSAQQSKTIDFVVQVPETADGDNVIYCSAYERCSTSDYPDGMESDHVIKEISVILESENTRATNLETGGQECSNSLDCPGLLLGKLQCVNGFCVDAEDVSESASEDYELPKLTNTVVGDWMGKHSYILFIVGLILVVIGAAIAFSEKKQKFQF